MLMKKISISFLIRLSMLFWIPLVCLEFESPAAVAKGARVIKPVLPALIGRWDMTVSGTDGTFPSWLEVQQSGNRILVGQFVGSGGSARPISQVFFDSGRMHFSIPPQWEGGDHNLSVAGILQGDSLSGTMVASDGVTYTWVGVRAPSLRRQKPPVWGSPVRLFDGNDLKGWHAQGKNQWEAVAGVMQSRASGSNIVTDDRFTDFKLHIEFMYPAGSNSGVYLRGRYEVQIADSDDPEPVKNQLSSVYGFLAPSEMAAKKAGEWQSYDITLVGRMVTIVFNGRTVICNQEIPGITGGAIDSNEAEPGPILLQGDHGPISFRNIVITKAE
jgi:hypothetical protein